MAELTTAGYIQHHLEFLKTEIPFGIFIWTHFYFLFYLVLFFFFFFYKISRKSTSGVPSKLQCFVEILVGWVDDVVKENFHGPRNVIAPLALTIFCWVFIMNAIDLVPVDFLPQFLIYLSTHLELFLRQI